MSSGPDHQVTTTQTNPSHLLENGIFNAANSANQAAGRIVGPGVDANNLTDSIRAAQGSDALFNRGQQGSPLVGSAQDLTQRTIQGDFLSPDSNPFLQGTFDRAADLTRTRLGSEFAGSGRNIAASAPARSEELQTLASNIFGGNFARERGLQANAVNQSLPLANNDFNDINAMIDAGNLRLDTLINRIGALAPAAGGTAVSSQPLHRNQGAGALGGALAGAQLGSIVPGLGTGIGALGGGLLGLFG